jgi:hypothetical protein
MCWRSLTRARVHDPLVHRIPSRDAVGIATVRPRDDASAAMAATAARPGTHGGARLPDGKTAARHKRRHSCSRTCRHQSQRGGGVRRRPSRDPLLPAATSARTSTVSRTGHGSLLGRTQRHGAPRVDGTVVAGLNGNRADVRVGLPLRRPIHHRVRGDDLPRLAPFACDAPQTARVHRGPPPMGGGRSTSVLSLSPPTSSTLPVPRPAPQAPLLTLL